MFADLRLLLTLRSRQLGREADYWLKSLSYSPEHPSVGTRLFALYILAIVLVLLGLLLSDIVATAVLVGAGITPATQDSLVAAVPAMVLVVQLVLLLMLGRSSPLKLSYPDVAYLASAPLSCGALIALRFLRQAGLSMIGAGLAAGTATMLITQHRGESFASAAGLRALSAALPLTLYVLALAWLAGLWRLSLRAGTRGSRRALGIVFVAAAVPLVLDWPEQTLRLAILHQAGATRTPLLWGLAIVVAAGMIGLGEQVNLVAVADESRLYARIKAFGSMAMFLAPEALREIRQEERRAGRRARAHLPPLEGYLAYSGRAALDLLRHPAATLWLLAWGAAMTKSAAHIVVSPVSGIVWAGWLVALALLSSGLLRTFRADTREPFLRQFLALPPMPLLLADTAPSLLVLFCGGSGGWLSEGPSFPTALLGLAFVLVLSCLLACLQGLSGLALVGMRRRLPAQPLIVVSFGAVGWLGVSGHSAPPALVLAVVLLAGASWLLRTARWLQA